MAAIVTDPRSPWRRRFRGRRGNRGRPGAMRHNHSSASRRTSWGWGPAVRGEHKRMTMIGSRFSPEIRRALRIDISATLLFTVFAGLTGPFIGLILRAELGATPLQLAVMSSAGGACLLLSLLWARAFHGRPPLPYLVWPGFVARGVFLLVPFVSSAWSFVGLVIARDFFGAAAAPAQAAVVERVYPPAQRGRALGLVRMIGAVLGIGLALAAGQLFERVGYRWIFVAAALLGMAASLRQRRLAVPEPVPFGGGAPARPRGAWLTVREALALPRPP